MAPFLHFSAPGPCGEDPWTLQLGSAVPTMTSLLKLGVCSVCCAWGRSALGGGSSRTLTGVGVSHPITAQECSGKHLRLPQRGTGRAGGAAARNAPEVSCRGESRLPVSVQRLEMGRW